MNDSLGDGKTILVIDDEYVILQALQEVLEMDGYRVITASNGREGLEVLRDQPPPSLIVLDMVMPIMNGRAFLDCLANDEQMAQIPVVVLSGTADKENARGARILLRKPPDLDTLLHLVAMHANPPPALS